MSLPRPNDEDKMHESNFDSRVLAIGVLHALLARLTQRAYLPPRLSAPIAA